MIFRLSLLITAAGLLPLAGQDVIPPLTPAAREEEKEEKKNSIIDVPAGAVITGLTLPYYDDDQKKVSFLTIRELTVNDEDQLDTTLLTGKTLKLWLFDKFGEIRSTTTIPEAIYLVDEERLEAKGEILMRGADNQFAAKSNGGFFSLDTGQAFLLGPAVTRFQRPAQDPKPRNPKTSMKRSSLLPLAAATQLAQVALAAPPEITAEQLANFERSVAPRIVPEIDSLSLQEADDLNADLDSRLSLYLAAIDQPTLIGPLDQTGPDALAKDPLADLFTPGPESIVITGSKGAYFDGENSEVVYFGNIKIEGQGLLMTCKRDLKALFHPPAKKAPKVVADDGEKKKDETLAKFGGLGDLKQFTASGDVRLSGVNEQGQTFYVGGDRALYQMEQVGERTDSTVTFRGDKIAFKIVSPKEGESKGGTYAMKSTSPDATVIVTLKGEKAFIRWSETGWKTHLGLPK